MQNFFKAIFFLFLTLLFVLACTLFVFNSTGLVAKGAKKALGDCAEFKIRNVDFSLDGSWVWDNVSFHCQTEEGSFKGNIREMVLENAGQLILAQEPVRLRVEGLNYESPQLDMRESEITLAWNRMDDFSGTWRARRVDVLDYRIMFLKGDLFTDTYPLLEIRNIQGDFYDGKLTGKISLDYSEEIPYHINISVDEANLDLLDDASQTVFGAIHGFMDIHLNLRGDQNHIKSLEGSLDLADGSSMNALLLKFLLKYLPKKSQEKAVLETLIQKKGNVLLDDGAFHFSSFQDDQLKGQMLLKSKELNLDADIALDVQIEGGMKNIFNLLERLGQASLP